MKRFFNCIALRGIVVEIRKNESINGILNRIMRMSSRKYEEPIETNDESTERTRSGGSREKKRKKGNQWKRTRGRGKPGRWRDELRRRARACLSPMSQERRVERPPLFRFVYLFCSHYPPAVDFCPLWRVPSPRTRGRKESATSEYFLISLFFSLLKGCVLVDLKHMK